MHRARWKRKNVRRDFGREGPKIAYHTGAGRERVPSSLRWPPHGRGGVWCRFDSGFPRRGCGEQRGARTHLTSFSFRAFRSARRCLVLRGTMERQRGQKQRPCNFPHRTHGTRPGKMSGPARAGRRPAGLAGTDSGDPRQRGGPLHRSAAKKRPFLLDRPQPVFFSGKTEKKMGGGWHHRPTVNSSSNGAHSRPPFGGPPSVSSAGRCGPADNPW